MKVCHVILHSCVRVHKLAFAQAATNCATPYLFSMIFKDGHPYWQYRLAFRFFMHLRTKSIMEEHFRDSAREIDPLIDIWHVHNEHDFMAPIIRKITEKPIIWDVHDLASHQKQDDKYRPDEDKSAFAANRILTVSPAYARILQERYPGRKVSWYPSHVPSGFFPAVQKQAKKPGVVYEGGVNIADGHHRNWFDFFEHANAAVDMYGAQPCEIPKLKRVQYFSEVEYMRLMESLAMYEAGIVGSPEPHPRMVGALPNKLFEYLAAGIPVICVNAPEDVRAFVEEHQVGVFIDAPEQMKEAVLEVRRRKLREHVAEIRTRWTMEETFMRSVLPVYQELVGGSDGQSSERQGARGEV